MSSFKMKILCDYCGSSKEQLKHYYKVNYYNSSVFNSYSFDGNLKQDLKLVSCLKCGVVRQNPIFNKEYFKLIYPLNENFVYNIEDLNLQKAKFKFLLTKIKEFHRISECENFWDFGCRDGVLPFLLREQGKKAFGIEMNQELVSQSNKIGLDYIFEGNIEDKEFLLSLRKSNTFDVVHMNDVLEHLIKPFTFLRNLSSLQGKESFLILNQMNIDSIGYKVFRKHWYYIHAQHIYYFSGKFLDTFMKELGYQNIYKHEIPAYKSLRFLPFEFSKLFKDYIIRNYPNSNLKNKWFAEFRPKLFDYSFNIYKKN